MFINILIFFRIYNFWAKSKHVQESWQKGKFTFNFGIPLQLYGRSDFLDGGWNLYSHISG